LDRAKIKQRREERKRKRKRKVKKDHKRILKQKENAILNQGKTKDFKKIHKD